MAYSETRTNERITGAEAVARVFLEEGVDTVFGYPGGYIMSVFDALLAYRDNITTILTRHEQGAVHAAQGYARASGKVGVVLVTSGPGASNIVTGAADAMLDSTPLVIIAGQSGVELLGTDSFQETDLIGITQPVTKWNYQIRRAEDILRALAKAFYIAREGRPGPVVLDFSKDAQAECLTYRYEKCTFIRSYQPCPVPDEEAVRLAAEWINAAEKPLAVVGQGVQLGHAEKQLLDFLEKGDIPAATTLMGRSVLPAEHSLNMGMVGMHGNVAPNRKTNECDLLIAIGMRFADRVTCDAKQYATQARIIHMDIDSSEFNKNVHADLPLAGNVRQTLPMLTELLENRSHQAWRERFEADRRLEWEAVVKNELHPGTDGLTMAETVNLLSECSGRKVVCVSDVGQNQMAAARYFKASPDRRYVASGGLGTMGFCLPAAIGAALGAPGSEIYAVCGDGGFQMTGQELGTIMQYRLPVKILLLNNNYLGMVRQLQEIFLEGRYASTKMMNPDFIQIAKAYGIEAWKVEERTHLKEAVERLVGFDGPCLLEVKVEEKGLVLPMIPSGHPLSDMILGHSFSSQHSDPFENNRH